MEPADSNTNSRILLLSLCVSVFVACLSTHTYIHQCSLSCWPTLMNCETVQEVFLFTLQLSSAFFFLSTALCSSCVSFLPLSLSFFSFALLSLSHTECQSQRARSLGFCCCFGARDRIFFFHFFRRFVIDVFNFVTPFSENPFSSDFTLLSCLPPRLLNYFFFIFISDIPLLMARPRSKRRYAREG